MPKVNIQSIIKILLIGKIENLPRKQVETWFKTAFSWIDSNQRFMKGANLIAAKKRWEKIINK